MYLLPPGANACPVCAVAHDPRFPHDATSLYYQMRFYGLRGRWPTWADAAAHCAPAVVDQWKEVAAQMGIVWTQPHVGEEPIADPPAESLRQGVGDPNSPGFGPEPEG